MTTETKRIVGSICAAIILGIVLQDEYTLMVANDFTPTTIFWTIFAECIIACAAASWIGRTPGNLFAITLFVGFYTFSMQTVQEWRNPTFYIAAACIITDFAMLLLLKRRHNSKAMVQRVVDASPKRQ